MNLSLPTDDELPSSPGDVIEFEGDYFSSA
jgi:hypothetical protein